MRAIRSHPVGAALALAMTGMMLAPGPATAGVESPHHASGRAATTVDDRALTRSGAWSNKSFAGAYAGTLSKSKGRGASLTSAATTGGGEVVLQFGPDRGKVDVLVGGVKKVSIKTAAKKKKLKTVRFSGDGAVTLKVKSPGKGVYVDALVITLSSPPAPPAPPGPPAPAAGQVVFTEWLSNPDLVPEASGEWFELHNVTAGALDLTGCSVTSQSAATSALPAGTLSGVATYLVARSADSATNGGISPNATFNFSLLTNGTLTLTCGATTIDTVSWTGETSGQTRSLDPDHYNATDNDLPANFCLGSVPYGSGGDLGTPGALNSQCP